jgi:hypothetical protein
LLYTECFFFCNNALTFQNLVHATVRNSHYFSSCFILG